MNLPATITGLLLLILVRCTNGVKSGSATCLWVLISEPVAGEGLVPLRGRPPATADLRQGPPLQRGIGDSQSRNRDRHLFLDCAVPVLKKCELQEIFGTLAKK